MSGKRYKNASDMGTVAVETAIEDSLMRSAYNQMVFDGITPKDAKKALRNNYSETLEATLGDGYGDYGETVPNLVADLEKRGLSQKQIINAMRSMRDNIGYTIFNDYINLHDASTSSSTAYHRENAKTALSKSSRERHRAKLRERGESVASSAKKSSVKAPSSKHSTATRSEVGEEKHYSKLPSYYAKKYKDPKEPYTFRLSSTGEVVLRKRGKPTVAPTTTTAGIPTRQSELPTTREGYEELAGRINAAGGLDGKPIRVYNASSIGNIRKNFILRLKLTGKK